MASPNRSVSHSLTGRLSALALGVLTLSSGIACNNKAAATKRPVETGIHFGPKSNVPEYLRGSIYELVEVGNTTPYEVSGYGLMVNLDHTGGSETLPAAVKAYMVKEMVKGGFGSKLIPGFGRTGPEKVLQDDRVSVVEVHGMLPPGIRRDQTFDVRVNVVPRNETSSLAGGTLYLTNLKNGGVNPVNPYGAVNTIAQAHGNAFVNPAYALQRSKGVTLTGGARAALRTGLVMDGGVASADRPIILQIREPQTSIARAIEGRIRGRFANDNSVARAHDEGLIELYVPTARFGSDWQHFVGVCTHSYFNTSPEFIAAKSKQLVEEALKPNAPLGDISYCWEGLGSPALPFVLPLLTNRSPSIAYAAARAAAFIGDDTGAAMATLMEMARTRDHPFQLEAVHVLGAVGNVPAVNHMLRELLDSDKTLVRIEAYRVLARNHDASVYSKVINEKFILDIVPSMGPPLIYATRSGMPRIAIIGTTPQVIRPVDFLTLENRLMISSSQDNALVNIFYRDPNRPHPISARSRADVPEIIGRLGGLSATGETPFDFSYGDIVAILQTLSTQHKLTVIRDGQYALAPFVLQEAPKVLESVLSAPAIDSGRPQSETSSPIGQLPAGSTPVRNDTASVVGQN